MASARAGKVVVQNDLVDVVDRFGHPTRRWIENTEDVRTHIEVVGHHLDLGLAILVVLRPGRGCDRGQDQDGDYQQNERPSNRAMHLVISLRFSVRPQATDRSMVVRTDR